MSNLHTVDQRLTHGLAAVEGAVGGVSASLVTGVTVLNQLLNPFPPPGIRVGAVRRRRSTLTAA